MQLAGGSLRFLRAERMPEALSPGWKLVLLLEGRLRYRVGGGRVTTVCGPAVHHSLCREPWSMEHEFDSQSQLRFVSVRLPLDALACSCGLDGDELAYRLGAGTDAYAESNRAAPPGLMALARQMLDCPVPDALRELYLSAKASELAALSLAALLPRPASSGLSPADCERLHQARDQLLAHLQQPPSLPALAAAVGINVNKLTSGFRRLFGQSVYAFVRQARMAQAHALLAEGRLTVSQAAYACGYTDSHFSKVFHLHYGVLPRDVAR
ncbi:helix-turn-helix transcriptional regulator [Bordetella holmesii]|uniref:DNA-binding helix-turn-helix protein n=3 Tax=Bordetella holmesii TaxID=35814 RepID=A0A158M5M0_9BORD|nr:AraC family transcriptional regulator [Bordetella holmesii]AHV92785.1 bacterial regulatory helix-turn-helix s, AraC family protein [Bordetella holmesii ATCC 51541]AIT28421.1 bacterial regulatory helix-turn-helix s, AraC family protein [Bordetella holmesii 44057]AMD47086.1 AraC family transcriptional regulator [Bordetella holmesii H558]EWM41215.1 bacterial regulatory helix-turn-helix s, AraC family protein [Bordetella holmesii 35009]EWM41419.1 bacterial regulatory helix-turn-helix s, AraC fa